VVVGVVNFASTLPKPHEPTLQPKLCQRACKANAGRNCLKKLPTLKKIKNADTRADTEKQESKMTMTRKLNNDNGLRGQTKEHQAVTRGIFYCRICGLFEVGSSYETLYQLDKEVLRNRQQKHTAIRYAQN